MEFFLHEGNREAYNVLCALAVGKQPNGLYIVAGQIISGKSSLICEAERLLIGRTTGIMPADEVLEELEFADIEQCKSFVRECLDKDFILIDELAETNKEEEHRLIVFLELILDLGKTVILGVDGEKLSPELFLYLFEKKQCTLNIRYPNLEEREQFTASRINGLVARFAPENLAKTVASKCRSLLDIEITLSYFELWLKYYIQTKADPEYAAEKAAAFFECYEQDKPEPLPIVEELLQEDPGQSPIKRIFYWQSIGDYGDVDDELDF